MNDITMEQYRTLPADERVLFRQELVVAILQVISRHLAQWFVELLQRLHQYPH